MRLPPHDGHISFETSLLQSGDNDSPDFNCLLASAASSLRVRSDECRAKEKTYVGKTISIVAGCGCRRHAALGWRRSRPPRGADEWRMAPDRWRRRQHEVLAAGSNQRPDRQEPQDCVDMEG